MLCGIINYTSDQVGQTFGPNLRATAPENRQIDSKTSSEILSKFRNFVKILFKDKYIMWVLPRTEKLRGLRIKYFQSDWMLSWLKNGEKPLKMRATASFWRF